MIALSLKNLARHRGRTAVAVATISTGIMAFCLAGGFVEWVFWAMREAAIHSRFGHLQVVRKGYFENGGGDPFAFLLPGEGSEFKLIEAFPGVDVVAPRLSFSGLISRGENTVSFLGEGVDPAKEKRVSHALHLREGEDLAEQEPNQVILGSGLAASLGASTGDTLALLATTSSGGINALEAKVAGIFFTDTKAYDDTVLRIPIRTAQELLRVSGAHRWVILLHDTAQTGKVLNRLQIDLGGAGSGFELVPWHKRADFYNKTVVLFSRQVGLVQVIIGAIIVLSISNTLMMAVLDRTAEVGTLMAMGLKRQKILQLFWGEGVLLGLFGGAMGLALGSTLAIAISAVGIPMPPPPGMDVGFTGEIRLTPGLALRALVLALATATLASVFPAWKASRLDIVDALRHGR